MALIRRGRLAAVRSLAELRRTSPRRVTVELAAPVDGAPPSIPGATLCLRDARHWVFEVTGPLGGLIAALDHLPIADLDVARFSLEEYVLRLFSDDLGDRAPNARAPDPQAVPLRDRS